MGPEKTRKLLSAERESLICRSLTAGVKTISELSDELHVSEATVRRDLETLESQGIIRRVYGGAELLRKRHIEPLYEEKASLHAPEKARIAEAAVKFVQEGDTIFLDGGSTVLEMARRLPPLRDLTVVTNSLMAAADLILCRAGASTLAELCYTGKPALLVPSPNVTNNHQEKNARVLERAGGARVLLEGEFDADSLLEEIKALLKDEEKLHSMGEAMKTLSVRDATERITEMILELCQG